MEGFYRMVDRTFPINKEPPLDAAPDVRRDWEAHKEKQEKAREVAIQQLSIYENKQSLFGRPEAMKLAKCMPACVW